MPKAKVKLGDNLLEKLVPVLLVASIALAFAVGVLWQKVNSLGGGATKGVTTGAGTGGGTTIGAGGTSGDAQPQRPQLGKLPEEQAKKLPPVSDSDHVRGNRNALVFLVEYSDFECPFCQRFHPTTKQLLEEYGDKLGVVYRHFPLEQIHSKAKPAAIASECIAELGGNDAFWKFADEVFADQQSSLADLPQTAAKVGVNKDSVQSCIQAEKYASKVQEQFNAGLAAGVTGTPGNFIVNKKGEAWFIPGAYPYDQIKPLVDEALKQS